MKHGLETPARKGCLVADRIREPIESEADIVAARQRGRSLATRLGFSRREQIFVVAVVTELARNILDHSRGGEVLLSLDHRGEAEGLVIVGRDRGPGIRNVGQALEPGFSTGSGVGIGLPGAKVLSDEFEVASGIGTGTTITARRWCR